MSTLEYCVRRLLEDDWRKRQRVIRTEWLKKEKLSVVPQKRRQELNDFLDEVDPKPDVRITPLPSTKELNEHLKSYEVITSIKLTSFKTNSEFPDENDDFIKSLTGAQERLNSDKIKTDLSNNVGLDKNQSEKLLSAAANGNYAAELKGKDSEGHKLDGDLKSLAIKIEMLLSPREDSDLLASKVLNRMKAAITRGLVNVSESADSHLEKANKILNRIKAVTK